MNFKVCVYLFLKKLYKYVNFFFSLRNLLKHVTSEAKSRIIMRTCVCVYIHIYNELSESKLKTKIEIKENERTFMERIIIKRSG